MRENERLYALTNEQRDVLLELPPDEVSYGFVIGDMRPDIAAALSTPIVQSVDPMERLNRWINESLYDTRGIETEETRGIRYVNLTSSIGEPVEYVWDADMTLSKAIDSALDEWYRIEMNSEIRRGLGDNHE